MLDEDLAEGETIPDDDADDNPATNAEASVTVAPTTDDDPDDTKATATRNSSDNNDDEDTPTLRSEPDNLTTPAPAPVSDLPPSVTAIIQAALATDRPVHVNIYLNGK